MRALAAVLLLLLGSPALAQDGVPAGSWKVEKEARFTLTWDYSFKEHMKLPDGKRTRSETRKVTAELTAEESFTGKGVLNLEIKHAEWHVLGVNGWSVRLTLDPTKSPDPKGKVDKGEFEAEAAAQAEDMIDQLTASYRVRIRPDITTLQVQASGGRWAGGFQASSIFNRCYVHSDLPPEDERKQGMKWEDGRDMEWLQTFRYPNTEAPKIVLRLIKGTGTSGAVVKGKGSGKFSGVTMENWKYSGKSIVKREFEFSSEGYLASSAEDAKSQVTEIDRQKKGRKKNGNIEIVQTLTIVPK